MRSSRPVARIARSEMRLASRMSLRSIRATLRRDTSQDHRMDIHNEQAGDVHVVTASGRLDGIYSSAGLRAVLVLMKKAQASGGVFALCGVNEQVREVLSISGFADLFSIHAGRAE